MSGKRWTEDEIKLLYTGMSNKDIAEKLGRTVKAVEDKRYSEHIRIASPEKMSKISKECRILSLAKKLGVKLWTRNEK